MHSFLLHLSKDFLPESSNRSSANNKLNFKSLNLEMQFHHKARCRLLPIFSRASYCKFFKDCKQGQRTEISSQRALQSSHLILQVLNQREQNYNQNQVYIRTWGASIKGNTNMHLRISSRWEEIPSWPPFCLSCEIKQNDGLLTAQYIYFHMYVMSHCFPFKSAFIFSCYDALFSTSRALWVCLLTSPCFCQRDNNCKLCSWQKSWLD